jgi:hypothetical protein
VYVFTLVWALLDKDVWEAYSNIILENHMSTQVPTKHYSSEDLNKEHRDHVEKIQRIMAMVSEPYDNLRNPVPLFSQLEPSR